MVIYLKTKNAKLVDKYADDLNSGIKIRNIQFSDDE